jgi:hypothetical protein
VQALEDLLADSHILEQLEDVLYGRPFPGSADVKGAIEWCRRGLAKTVHDMFQRLKDHQASIREVCQSWDAVPTIVFGGSEQRADFHHIAIREGLFRNLVTMRESEPTVDRFLLTAGLNPSVRARPNHREILQRWVTPFRWLIDPLPLIIVEDEEMPEGEPKGEKQQKQRRREIDRSTVLGNVERTKEFIVKIMQRRDFARVRKIIDQLVEYQLSLGGPQYAVKSLCDLAAEAKALGIFWLQLELTERSVGMQPDDDWAWRQYGDALLNMLQLHEALKAYEQADALGGGVVAKNGRAEVLKALGRLDEALSAYDAITAEYPRDVIAKTGRICLLAALRRYPEALAELPDQKPVTQQDWIRYHIRGMILLRKGDVDEAFRVFEAGVKDDPWPLDREYFHTALAVAWIRRKDFAKASQVLEDVTTPLLQAQADVLRLHSFGFLGKRERAAAAYGNLKAKPRLQSAEVTKELYRRYLLTEEPHYNDEWVVDHEVELFLLAA